MTAQETSLEEQSFGAITVLFGERGGKYPQGNSLLVRGGDETLLIDPSLGRWSREARRCRASIAC